MTEENLHISTQNMVNLLTVSPKVIIVHCQFFFFLIDCPRNPTLTANYTTIQHQNILITATLIISITYLDITCQSSLLVMGQIRQWQHHLRAPWSSCLLIEQTHRHVQLVEPANKHAMNNSNNSHAWNSCTKTHYEKIHKATKLGICVKAINYSRL